MRWIFLLILGVSVNSAAHSNTIEIHRNEPFWYVYMPFEGYHKQYKNFEPEFIQELEKQKLYDHLIGEPFNLYFSENDWAIGCRIQENINIQKPLIKGHYKNTRVASSIYTGTDNNISLYLQVTSNNIYKKYYYWDGPLIIKDLSNKDESQKLLLQIPLTKDYYRLFIKPYGIVRVVIIFLCLLFTIFLLTYKKGRILSNRIFGILTLTCVLRDCCSFLWILNINQNWPHLYDFTISLNFLTGPLLLFYTWSVVKEKFTLRKIHLFHLVPLLIVAVVYFIIYQMYDTETKLRMLNNGFRNSEFFTIIHAAHRIQLILYLLASVLIIYRYRFTEKHLHQNTEKNLVSTVRLLMTGLLILVVFGIIREIIPAPGQYHYVLKGIGILFNLVLISVLLIRCLRYPDIFSYSGKNGNGQKYHKSPLTAEHKKYYLGKLITYMKESKSYLSSAINLPGLSKEISIPSRYISQVLNEELGMSFYDFINKYRIEEAKTLLLDPENNTSSIIDIAYDCGFNSKSVFNAAFKKYTGRTPSEYRMENHISVR